MMTLRSSIKPCIFFRIEIIVLQSNVYKRMFQCRITQRGKFYLHDKQLFNVKYKYEISFLTMVTTHILFLQFLYDSEFNFQTQKIWSLLEILLFELPPTRYLIREEAFQFSLITLVWLLNVQNSNLALWHHLGIKVITILRCWIIIFLWWSYSFELRNDQKHVNTSNKLYFW